IRHQILKSRPINVHRPMQCTSTEDCGDTALFLAETTSVEVITGKLVGTLTCTKRAGTSFTALMPAP
ncbi:MAG: hypothetical protein ACREXR_17580, partial [Gammaproteobacteria bacterium]